MKTILLLLLVAGTARAMSRPRQMKETMYTTKYDNIELDVVLNNRRLFNNYFNCLMDKGKCTVDGLELKRIIPDVLENGCNKCSEKQKQATIKVFQFMLMKKPKQFAQLEKKYDPSGKYRKMHEAEVRKMRLH